MTRWSNELEEELTLLLKDWLKQQGRTQADLQKGLKAESPRMPFLIEVLKTDYIQGGLTKLASHLCEIEEIWACNKEISSNKIEFNPTINEQNAPFDQLDLLLKELDEDSKQEE